MRRLVWWPVHGDGVTGFSPTDTIQTLGQWRLENFPNFESHFVRGSYYWSARCPGYKRRR